MPGKQVGCHPFRWHVLSPSRTQQVQPDVVTYGAVSTTCNRARQRGWLTGKTFSIARKFSGTQALLVQLAAARRHDAEGLVVQHCFSCVQVELDVHSYGCQDINPDVSSFKTAVAKLSFLCTQLFLTNVGLGSGCSLQRKAARPKFGQERHLPQCSQSQRRQGCSSC